MEFKNILNHDSVTLTNCEHEPIHIPGSIQPYGCLIAVNIKTGKIEFASGNTQQFLGIDFHKLLDKPFSDIFTRGLDQPDSTKQPEGTIQDVKLELMGKEFHAFSHHYQGYRLFEFETENANEANPDLLNLSQEFVGYIENTKTITELSDKVVHGIRKVTGYDRVMIYRFDEKYNGEVISESKEDHLESFLGLHYPHTDIPPQARQLYIKNQIRIITDVNYTPEPIYTPDTGSASQLDLSFSLLRSVSPIHCQYLRNMGVGATLTISLLHKNQLWGLIACHHYSAKHLPFNVRMAAKLMGHFITSQIDTRRESENLQNSIKSENAIKELLNTTPADVNGFLSQVFNNDNILKVCNASGVSACVDGQLYQYGITPDAKEFGRLAVYFSTYTRNSSAHTHALKEIVPELKSIWQRLPGLIYFSLDISAGNCIMWHRVETIKEVSWAGDPSKSIEHDKNGLSPRKSFAAWTETVKNQSGPWLSYEIDSAAGFVQQFQKDLSALALQEEEKKQRNLAIALKQTNDELENINWISSHDLQEPLRKIQMMASIIMDNEKQESVDGIVKKVQKMNDFATRMRTLLANILKYTRLNSSQEAFERINFANLVKEIATEEKDVLQEHNAMLRAGNHLPVIFGVNFLIKQVLLNLIFNSLKFKHPSRDPVLEIELIDDKEAPELGTAGNYFIIRYRDNGIGFNDEDAEKIFNIFTRLHEASQYEGSGIGLSLCRKIMAAHKGHIRATGKKGEGASFYLYFPRS